MPLIPLSQRKPGVVMPTPGMPYPPAALVLVGSEQILFVEPNGTGSTVCLVGGIKLAVMEDADLVLDLASDEGTCKKAATERKKVRDERLALEAKTKADAEHAAAKVKAAAAEEEAQRHRIVAERAAKVAAEAKTAAHEAGVKEVTHAPAGGHVATTSPAKMAPHAGHTTKKA